MITSYFGLVRMGTDSDSRCRFCDRDIWVVHFSLTAGQVIDIIDARAR